MADRRLGIIMHGVTGRMGTNQHLIRSILAIRNQGGVRARRTARGCMPDPILVGRDAGQARGAGGRARRRALDDRSRRGARRHERPRVLRCRLDAAARRAACAGDRRRQARLLREAGRRLRSRMRWRSDALRREGRREARRRAGQAVAARPAQAEDADRQRLLRPHPVGARATSATGCSRATGSRRSGRPGTTARRTAAASSSTCCATGATCSTTCSAR